MINTAVRERGGFPRQAGFNEVFLCKGPTSDAFKREIQMLTSSSILFLDPLHPLVVPCLQLSSPTKLSQLTKAAGTTSERSRMQTLRLYSPSSCRPLSISIQTKASQRGKVIFTYCILEFFPRIETGVRIEFGFCWNPLNVWRWWV